MNHILIKEEAIDSDIVDKNLEPLPTQCRDDQDRQIVTTKLLDEVTVKEDMVVYRVPHCKVEPGTSESTLSLGYNAPRDDVTSNKQDSSCSRYIKTEALISCKKCDHKCTLVSELKQHMHTHTGEKKIACDLCSYKCKRKDVLVVHMRTHTGEKPYTCHLCSYKCKQKSRLNKHVRIHTGEPYKCKQNGVLVEHMRTHTGKKPYNCHLCTYRCNSRSNLIKHMRTHTGEKPYYCHLCSYKCKQKSALVRHIDSIVHKCAMYRNIHFTGETFESLL